MVALAPVLDAITLSRGFSIIPAHVGRLHSPVAICAGLVVAVSRAAASSTPLGLTIHRPSSLAKAAAQGVL